MTLQDPIGSHPEGTKESFIGFSYFRQVETISLRISIKKFLFLK